MKEKGTKNFLETGRTFATIFADIELRAKIIKSYNTTRIYFNN